MYFWFVGKVATKSVTLSEFNEMVVSDCLKSLAMPEMKPSFKMAQPVDPNLDPNATIIPDTSKKSDIVQVTFSSTFPLHCVN